MSEHMHNAASVDIAIPCYQYGRFLRECVMSVLSQGIPNVRILIIDNASTDNSLEVAQQLAADDPRVEVVAHRTNLGQHASYNEAIDWASSTYFVMLCADDLLVPGSFARSLAIMKQCPEVGFVYGQAIPLHAKDPMPVFDADPRKGSWRVVSSDDILRQLCSQAASLPPGPSALMVRTATQKVAGYYRSELPHTDDLEMCLRLACLAPVAETRAPLAIVRIHEANRSGFRREERSRSALRSDDHRRFFIWHEEDEAAFDSFFAHEGRSLPEASHLHRLARRSIGERAYWSAWAHLCRGQTGASYELLKFALRRCPRAVVLPPVGCLFRRPNTVSKIMWVLSEMMRSTRIAARPARADG